MKTFTALLFLFTACARSNAQQPDLFINFQYMTGRQNLEGVSPAPAERGMKDLRIQEGGEILMRRCLDDPANWMRDPFIFRLAHKHSMTTIGCRERTNPSLHVVFYRVPDGSRQAWVHFDLYGPNNRPGHSLEIVRNRLTFSHTAQTGVRRSLLRKYADPEFDLHHGDYDAKAQFRGYLKATFSPQALVSSATTGSARALTNSFEGGPSKGWGTGFDSYRNHMEANFARHTIQQTIEFGASALLRQDETIATLGEDARVRTRIKAALYHSFFVEGPAGDEFAFPRLAAALGTAWVTDRWHPWNQRRADPWLDLSVILSRYVGRSFWQEFKPDVKNMRRKLFAGNRHHE